MPYCVWNAFALSFYPPNSDTNALVDLVFGSEENAEKLVDVESFKRVVVNYDNPPYTDTILTAYTDVNKAINEYTRYAHQGLMTAEEAMAQAKQIADEAIKNAD